MADRRLAEDTPELRARWGAFAWTAENAAKAKDIVARYPEGRQRSAVMPLLDLAQRQVGAETNTQGWLPIPVIEFVAAELGMPKIRAYEVATFYTMFNLAPVGRFHVQVCGTTPCRLRGAGDLIEVCQSRIHHDPFHLSKDGNFSWEEVECLGACVNAPMVLIWNDTYEDLTPESFNKVLDGFAEGNPPKPGPQVDRLISQLAAETERHLTL
jgi:NADH-quinone oxidoreductase subunit E